MKDTFTLWAHQDTASGKINWVFNPGTNYKAATRTALIDERVVKLECRIVQPQRKPKRGKYPNDNFGLPAGYKPHNPSNLTREQVGGGFRLLADVEIWSRERSEYDIACWHETFGWFNNYRGEISSCTYRVPINTPLDPNPELKTK